MNETREFNFKKFKDNPETVKAISFMKKYGFVLLLLIPILLSYSLRITPANLPITEQWAENSINTNIMNQLSNEVRSVYPNLPQDKINEMALDKYTEFKKQNQIQIDQEINNNAQYFKSRLQDENGNTYLLAIDPYFWSRLADNVVKNGHPGDYIKDGESWDAYMMAPTGREMPQDMFNAYAEAYLYQFVRIFNPDAVPMSVYFYMPIILMCLSCIPAFFIARRFGGNIAGFFSSVLVAIHPVILNRTPGGFADTDAYQIIFPLFIFWLFMLCYDSDKISKKIIYGALSGFLVGLYSITWGGWWYILGFVMASCFVGIIFSFINKNKIKDIIVDAGTILTSSLLFVTLFRGVGVLLGLHHGIIGFIQLHSITEVWPNVFTTVAEQNSGTFAGAISQLGGNGLFLLSIIGILSTLYFTWKKGKINVTYMTFLSLLLLLPCWAATRGVRFTLLAAPAFSIGVGVAVSFAIVGMAKLYQTVGLSKPKFWSVLIIVTITLFYLGLIPFSNMGLYGSAKQTALNEIPSMNDAWYNSLTKIDREAAPDAIINSWWDFGHWFKAIGNRAVTFDGTSQYTPMAYWIGRVLDTPDEIEAVSILRMLDCGSRLSVDVLVEDGYDVAKSVEIVRKIMYVNITDDDALTILDSYSVKKETQTELMPLVRCEPPENYLITSEDMVGKGGVWGHFGNWDLDKSQMFKDIKDDYSNDIEGGIQHLQDRFGLTEEESTNIYSTLRVMTDNEAANWISPWPTYNSGYIPCSNKENTSTVICGNGIIIDLDNMAVSFGDGMKPPQISTISYNGTIHTTRYKDFQPVGIFYSYDKNHVIVSDPLHVPSMFNRLHFDDGTSLQYFELFSYEKSVSGDNIYVWKVNWEKVLNNG